MTGAAAGARPLEMRSEPKFLSEERERIENALAAIAARGAGGFPDSLRDPVDYALSTSGKRLRPILCVLAYSAARPDEAVPEAAYRLACAVEIVHTYSLIHDDLPCMDDDDLRRGRATVHRVFGTSRATLAGAALLPLAIETLDRQGAELGLELATRASLVIELARAAGSEGMVGGQLLDLEGESRPVDVTHLERIHRQKTGALLTCSLRIGGIAGGGSPELLDALTRYGEALGLAFQITDDLLDIEGDSAALGKTAGRDAALRKSSYPAVHGIDGARARAREMSAQAKDAVRPLARPRLLLDMADYVIERYR